MKEGLQRKLLLNNYNSYLFIFNINCFQYFHRYCERDKTDIMVFRRIVVIGLVFIVAHFTRAQSTSSEQVVSVDSTMLSFTIKFCNSKTDTVHSLLIIDTLSADLDVSSFELGVSSHHYDFVYLDENVVCWHIYDVRIPGISDSLHNCGFVKYHIDSKSDDKKSGALFNNPSVYYNYDSDFTLDVANIAAFQHHEFVGVEHKANVFVEISDKRKGQMVIMPSNSFTDEQVYVEIFDENGTVEFLGKLNNQEKIRLNTSFLKPGSHYLDIYDNHHHEVVQHFFK